MMGGGGCCKIWEGLKHPRRSFSQGELRRDERLEGAERQMQRQTLWDSFLLGPEPQHWTTEWRTSFFSLGLSSPFRFFSTLPTDNRLLSHAAVMSDIIMMSNTLARLLRRVDTDW
jgi:hypothetical protein